MKFFLVLVVIAVSPFMGFCESNTQSKLESLADKYVMALRNSSVEELALLHHPDCPESQDSHARMIRTVKSAPEGDYEVKLYKKTPSEAKEALAFMHVAPSYQVSIEGTYRSEPMIWSFMAAEKSGEWYHIICLKSREERLKADQDRSKGAKARQK